MEKEVKEVKKVQKENKKENVQVEKERKEKNEKKVTNKKAKTNDNVKKKTNATKNVSSKEKLVLDKQSITKNAPSQKSSKKLSSLSNDISAESGLDKKTTKKSNEIIKKDKPNLKKSTNSKSVKKSKKDLEISLTKNLVEKDSKNVEDNNLKENKLKILYVASECQPFVATGGLGDVAGSLPKEIAKTNEVDIRVILPLYANIKIEREKDLQFIGNFTTHLAWRQEYCGIFKIEYEGVTYYFVDNERYFKRERPYGFFDDGERFAFFCKSIVESFKTLDFFPDIIHCNDWQSALVSAYLKTGNWEDKRYYQIKNIYTIHNVEYQGVYGMENLTDLFGIDYKYKNFLEYNSNINLTKSAIQFSDKFTTVSDSYCDNLKEFYCSGGLNYIIVRNEYKLCGIINGIDYEFYNPKTDNIIYYNYDINNFNIKSKNKLALQRDLKLPEREDVPMIAVVSRLVSHKGMGLIIKVIEQILKQDVQFIIVGTGDKRYVDYFNYLQSKYPNKVRALVDRYYGDMARKAYASSDIFLMPSKIEPCGISQMIASRYGSVPIVREVGGLKDSIKDFGCLGGGNGYTFTNYYPQDFYSQICKALNDYKNKPLWESRIKTVMSVDFSWTKSAHKYIQLYKSLVK